jgi:hypothetical protein
LGKVESLYLFYKKIGGRLMAKKVVYLLLLLVFVMSTAIANVSAAPKKEDSTAIVKGSIKDNGESLINSLVILQEKGKLDQVFTTTDGSGTFKAKLTDGHYAVIALKTKTSDWYSTHSNFVVEKGKVKGVEDGQIQLSDKKKEKKAKSDSPNLTGVLKEGNKGLKADLVLSKFGEYEEGIYTVSSKGNGSFSASLPDGEYILHGIEVDGGYYRYELFFSVVDGKVLVDGAPQTNLSITIPVNAYAGKVQDSTSPLSGAGISLEKRLSDDEYDTEFVQYVVANKKGEFALRALTDGTYTISVHHETYYGPNSISFEVVNGITYIDGEKTSSFGITVPDLNLMGRLAEGSLPISNAYVSFEGESADGEYFGFGAQVDSNGNFQYRLKDGNYTVTAIEEQNRSTMVNIPFEIRNGKLLQNGEEISVINIDLPPVTFKGTLSESGSFLQGLVYVEALSEDGNYAWYSATTDENGIYSLRLKDGSYQVTGGYLFNENEELALSVPFDIINGKLVVAGEEKSTLELEVPPVSLYGLVKDGEQPLTNGWISIVSEENGSYIGKSLNADGTFSMRLTDGNYKVMNVDVEDGTSAPVDLAFSIQDGKTYLNGQLQDTLEVSVPPVTLTGTLTESGNPIMGNVLIMELNDAENPLQSWAWASEEGLFYSRLPDGDYQVQQVELFDGTALNPGLEFSIMDGKLYVNGQLQERLDIDVPPVAMSGMLLESGNPIAGSLTIMELNDAENPLQFWAWAEEGKFQFRMPDGDYKIYDVNLHDSTAFSPGTEFSIISGQLYVTGELTEELTIDVPPVSMSGSVFNGEGPVTDGYLAIHSLDGNWTAGYPAWIRDGYYQMRLPDGEYEIAMIEDYQNGGSYYFDKKFTIADGKLYVDGQEASSLDINLQDGWQQP